VNNEVNVFVDSFSFGDGACLAKGRYCLLSVLEAGKEMSEWKEFCAAREVDIAHHLMGNGKLRRKDSRAASGFPN
jgi:hypothetical protein